MIGFKREYRLLYLSLIFFALFGGITALVLRGAFGPINIFTAQVAGRFHTTFFTHFFVVVAELGDWMSYSVLCLLLLLLPKTRVTMGLPATLAVVFSAAVNQLLKLFFSVPRPSYALVSIGGYSYPSGHAMNGLVFLGMLMYLAHFHMRGKRAKRPLLIFLGTFCALVALSRIYLGVHYFSDVLGGLCMGGCLLSLSIYLHRSTAEFLEGHKRE